MTFENVPRDGTPIEVGRFVDGEFKYCKSMYVYEEPNIEDSSQGDYWFWAEDWDTEGVIAYGDEPSFWRPIADPPTQDVIDAAARYTNEKSQAFKDALTAVRNMGCKAVPQDGLDD
jgi:hypothetical protein